MKISSKKKFRKMNELRKQMKPEMPDFPRLFEGKKSMMDMQGEKQQKMPFPGMSKKLLQQLLQQFLDMIFDAYSKEK